MELLLYVVYFKSYYFIEFQNWISGETQGWVSVLDPE